MPALSPEQNRLRASIASNERWAREPDRVAATQAARDGRWQRYLNKARQLAPVGASEVDVIDRAEKLRRADMSRMALASARSRAAKNSASGPKQIEEEAAGVAP